MARPPRDRPAGYLEFPDDLDRDPNWRRMGLAARGAFRTLKDALWKQPRVGHVEDDNRLLAALAGCALDEWIAVRLDVVRMFERVSAGDGASAVFVLRSMVEQWEANRRKHQTKANAGSKGGKSTGRKRKASSAAPDAEQRGSTDGAGGAATCEQRGQHDTSGETVKLQTTNTPPTLRSGGVQTPDAPVPSASGLVAVSLPLRFSETAPAAPPVPVENVGGEARDLVHALAAGLGGEAPAFPQHEAWAWVTGELGPESPGDRHVMGFMAWGWKDGVRDLELLKAMVREAIEKRVENWRAYFAKDGPARNCRQDAAAMEAADRENRERKAEERAWLAGSSTQTGGATC